MKKLRVLVLMDEELVPPATLDGQSDEEILQWKTEFDVLSTLKEMGHQTVPLGVSNELSPIRRAITELQPHIIFNLLEEFQGVAVFDQHVVSYLELLSQPYTGCNPRGLMLAHDKALSKKILTYHRILTPRFLVAERGKRLRVNRRLSYPLLVKSVIEEASLGIDKESIVADVQQLADRVAFIHDTVKTDALIEEYIEGREFYVGVVGNRRLVTFPVWEMLFETLPEGVPNIATRRVKWDADYQKALGVKTAAAQGLTAAEQTAIARLCKRVYRSLSLSGYARMDLRMRPDGQVYVLEANPNPNLSYGEDLAESAHAVGVSYDALIQRILNLGLSYKPRWYD